jgi:GT2 family glycosyltransferase
MQQQISLFRDFQYDVTVVMVSYHTGTALWRALDAVLEQEGLNELILVDNGNSQETRQRLVKKNLTEPRLKVLSGHGNMGLYQGCNLGADRAKGQYVLFISPETVLPHDFLLRMVDAYQKDAESFAATCMITDAYGHEKKESRQNLLMPSHATHEAMGLNTLSRKCFPAASQIHSPLPLNPSYDFFASTGCFLIERHLF